MLEIIALIYLTRYVGETVESKGRKGGWFKFMTVMLWIGGEITGAVIGGIVAAISHSGTLLVYLFAIAGAAVGAGISLVVAKSVSQVAYDQPPQPPAFR